jgi:diguanylate cyclase (GGDEF)-like protein
VVVPDPGADREINQVMGSLRSVSEELTGSRSELARAKGQLVDTERMVLVDPLTGVWNRRYLDRALIEQTKRFARYRRPFALLVIDVDQFKRVNDAHGHPAGDIVLRGIAQLIQRSIRADLDVLARFGGEEFVAVLPDTDAPGGWSAAEKIRTLVERSRFDASGAPVSVTVSIGVSACPQDGEDHERLLHAADSALYRAKEAGRNASVSAFAEHADADRVVDA